MIMPSLAAGRQSALAKWTRRTRIGHSGVAMTHAGDIQWGDFATWVAAVGTVSAVVVALVQVARERSTRLSREARDRNERHLAHARLISAWTGPAEAVPQTERVDYGDDEADAAYHYRTPVYVQNSSAEPIYEVVVGIVFIQGAAPRTLEGILDLHHQRHEQTAELTRKGADVATGQNAFRGDPATTSGIVPPGTWRLWVSGKGWTSIMAGRGGVDIAFVDRAGVSWVRRAMGPLDELPTRPLEHFGQHGLHGPHEFQVPERVN